VTSLNLRLSFLALAVSMATTAHAEVYDARNFEKTWTGVINEDVTIINGFTYIMGSTDLMVVKDATVQNFTNNAKLQIIGGTGTPLVFSNVQASGSLANNGPLKTSGENAVAFKIENSRIAGSVTNTATISTSGRTTTDAPASRGIALINSSIDGDLIHKGDVFTFGPNAIGIHVLTTDTSKIAGNLITSGTVSSNGSNSIGIGLDGAVIDGSVKTDYLVYGGGTNARALSVKDSTLGGIENNYVLNATGQNATALYIDNLTLKTDPQTNPYNEAVNNQRTIMSEGTGIRLTNFKPGQELTIGNAGSIQGTNAAIDGSGHTNLNMHWGRIKGDILGVNQLNIVKSGSFDSALIDAKAFNVQSNASAYISQPDTHLTGDLNLAGGSFTDLQLSSTTNPNKAYLTVAGNASFDNGSTVTVSAKPYDFKPTVDGVNYQLIKAASVDNKGLQVASSSYLLQVKSFAVDSTTVSAVVQAKPDEVFNDLDDPDEPATDHPTETGSKTPTSPVAPTTPGTTVAPVAPNATTAALLSMKNEVLAKMADDDKVFTALANAGTREEVARIAHQLTPDVNGAAAKTVISGQNLINHAIGTRISGIRTGRSSGDELAGVGFWAQALSNNTDQDRRNGMDGYQANSSGVAIGFDGKLNEQTTLGVAYSYLNSNISSDNASKIDVQGNALSLYGSYQLNNWFADASLTYGKNDNDSKRYIAGTQARGTYDSDVLGLNLLAGYDFIFNDIIVEPRVGARYNNVGTDGYREHGSSAALDIGKQRFESGEAGAGLRIASQFAAGMGTLEPEASVMAWHDFIGDKVTSTSSFVLGSTTFTTSGASQARDSYEASLGLNYHIGAVTVGANYNYQGKTGFDSETLVGRIRYDF